MDGVERAMNVFVRKEQKKGLPKGNPLNMPGGDERIRTAE